MRKITLLALVLFSIGFGLPSCKSNSKNGAADSLAKQRRDSLSNLKNSAKWLGSWNRNDWQNEAEIDITKIVGDSLVFQLQAGSGGHSGEIDGKASIKANQAFFKSAEDAKCSLILTLQGDSVIMIAATGCQDEGGIGVYFDGKYMNAKLASKTQIKEEQQTLVTLGLLNNQEDTVFRKLVGKSYQLFVNSTELTDEDVKDLDNMHAKIRATGVRGLFTYMENIIMIDSAKNICAAVINDQNVYYFTNDSSYRYQLPKTIDDWRSRFKDKAVVFK